MKRPIVLIEWRDAAGGARIGWRPMKEVERQETATCYSVGFLLRQTKEEVLVVPHVATIGDQSDGDAELCIPRSWVKKITVLRK